MAGGARSGARHRLIGAAFASMWPGSTSRHLGPAGSRYATCNALTCRRAHRRLLPRIAPVSRVEPEIRCATDGRSFRFGRRLFGMFYRSLPEYLPGSPQSRNEPWTPTIRPPPAMPRVPTRGRRTGMPCCPASLWAISRSFARSEAVASASSTSRVIVASTGRWRSRNSCLRKWRVGCRVNRS